MHELVQQFLEEKMKQEKLQYEEEKKKVLLELGICEKVYSSKNQWSSDYPFREDDAETKTTRWYQKKEIDISDEDYEAVKRYCKQQGICNDNISKQGGTDSNNVISTIFRVIAVIIYIVGFIASFYMGVDEYGDVSAMVIVWWVITFICGTGYLGFAEIIYLLNDIKNK